MELSVLAIARADAVEIYPNAGTTSAAFLKLGTGSRAVAMGSAFAGLADDVSALYWNPAGLAQLQRQEFQVYHNESFEGLRNDFIGYATPYGKGVMAVGVSGLYTPKDIERRSGLNETDPYEPLSVNEGLFQAYDAAAHFAYARWFGKNLAGGISVKPIQQTIDTYSAYAIGADLGLLYRCTRLPLSTGLVIQNIGTPIKFIATSYPLPLNFKLGGAWRWNRQLVSTLDFNKSIDNFLFVSAGSEYVPIDLLSLRVGYRYRMNGLELGDLSGLSAGVGFKIRLQDMNIRIDYAFVPLGDLGNSQQITVGMQFGASAHKVVPETAAQPKSQKMDYGVLSPAPVLPASPRVVSSADDTAGFVFNVAKISGKRRTASAHTVIYNIRCDFEKGDVESIKGNARMQNIAMLQVEAGVKEGKGVVYRHYTFRRNISERIQNVECVIKLPKDMHFLIRSEDGVVLPAQRIRQDTTKDHYIFSLDQLKPFAVEKKD
jgi:hypothetical protein